MVDDTGADSLDVGQEAGLDLRGYRKRWSGRTSATADCEPDSASVSREQSVGSADDSGDVSVQLLPSVTLEPPTLLAEQPVSQPQLRLAVLDLHGSEAAWKQCARDSDSKRRRLLGEPLPWESMPRLPLEP